MPLNEIRNRHPCARKHPLNQKPKNHRHLTRHCRGRPRWKELAQNHRATYPSESGAKYSIAQARNVNTPTRSQADDARAGMGLNWITFGVFAMAVRTKCRIYECTVMLITAG